MMVYLWFILGKSFPFTAEPVSLAKYDKMCPDLLETIAPNDGDADHL